MSSSIGWEAVKLGDFQNLLMANRQNNATRGRIMKVLDHYGDNMGGWYMVLNVDQWAENNPYHNLFSELDELMGFETGSAWNFWHSLGKNLKTRRSFGACRMEEKP